jgi:hypothetical protein
MAHTNASPYALPGESQADTIERLLEETRKRPAVVEMVDECRGSILTAQEQELLRLTSDVWNAFLLLPRQHPDDQTEFRHALHALQRIVLARPAVRATREICPAP